jgi:hypothetical protein
MALAGAEDIEQLRIPILRQPLTGPILLSPISRLEHRTKSFLFNESRDAGANRRQFDEVSG